ncbi:LacI family DNA-binding transcriptional regulator [Ruficoccus amylovorans]|uniref:LacI family DNA-binding transcriptional regulator n=1 Tax=Ruficoccus amylovorans TaxID=1804625 RepID=A0A842HBR5_9BACT|nr:LacI family DNA-binding transcriptional regulator [Ruficoccus amylovorans]MBC2593903.1 LacI family DNA-binding transcriptional regulator [Ruficoccus amylovorans]
MNASSRRSSTTQEANSKSLVSDKTDGRPMDLKGLARILNLSIVTVSRALNNRPGVGASTRQRVLEAARTHRYTPNGAARMLKDRPTMTVGLFFAPFYGPKQDINPNALNLIERLRKALDLREVEMRVFYYEGDVNLRTQALEVDVGIFYGHFSTDSFAVAHNVGIPAVLFDKHSPFPDQISVLVDAAQCCQQAVQYLVAQGHTRIGLMTGPLQELYFRKYAEAFPAALTELGLLGHSDWVFCLPGADCNQEGSREALFPLLQRKAPEERPTAMVFASDWLAIGGRRAALDAGLSIPRDFSLIGHDNMPVTADLDPPLTTFDMHIGRVVQTLTHLAVQLGSRTKLPRTDAPASRDILIMPDFVKRSSSVCLRPTLPDGANAHLIPESKLASS